MKIGLEDSIAHIDPVENQEILQKLRYYPELTVETVNTPILRALIEGNITAIKEYVSSNTKEEKVSAEVEKNLLLLTFLAIHTKNSSAYQCLRDNSQFIQELEDNIQKDGINKEGSWTPKNIDETSTGEKNLKSKKESGRGGISSLFGAAEADTLLDDKSKGNVSQRTELLQEVKERLETNAPNIIGRILQATIELKEEPIACLIAENYEAAISVDMYALLLKNKLFTLLRILFVNNKNIIGNRVQNHFHKIRLAELFSILKQNKQMKDANLILIWAKDLLGKDEKMILTLLRHHLDIFIIDNIIEYCHHIDTDVLLYALKNDNELFLRYILKNKLIEQIHFQKSNIQNYLVRNIRKGLKLFQAMNFLIFVDLKIWSLTVCRKLVDYIEDLLYQDYVTNKFLEAHNLILTLSLMAEFIQKIGTTYPILNVKCKNLVVKLVKFGGIYIHELKNEQTFTILFKEKDYSDRSLPLIITSNTYRDMFLDEKISTFLDGIWYGEDHPKCSGRFSDFSQLTYMAKYSSKLVGKKPVNICNIVSNQFSPMLGYNYSFQYKFRKSMIDFQYYLDLFFALCFLLVFQFSNFQYLELFGNDAFEGMNEKEEEEQMEKNLEKYKNYIAPALILTISILIHVIMKIIFNLASDYKLHFDKWTLIDILTIITNIICFGAMTTMDAESMMDNDTRYTIDFYLIAVAAVAWLRFFLMFLMNKHFSPLLYTLFKMISDTLAFMTIVFCYLILISCIFYTLYTDTNSEKFSTFLYTMRYLFSAMLGDFNYDGMGSREQSYSILLVIHLFFSCILLLNYLIAILATVYEIMKDYGDFNFRSSVFQYTEKYTIPLKDKKYTELAYNPAPLPIFTMFLVPFLPCPKLFKQLSWCFSLTIFWGINIVLIIAFWIYELILVPFCYFKVFFNILSSPVSALKKAYAMLMWLIFGLFILFYFSFKDTIAFVMILARNTSLSNIYTEASYQEKFTITILNQVLTAFNKVFKKLKYGIEHENNRGEVSHDDVDLSVIVDNLEYTIKDELEEYSEYDLTVVPKIIFDQWARQRLKAYTQTRLARNESMPDIKTHPVQIVQKVVTKLRNMLPIMNMQGKGEIDPPTLNEQGLQLESPDINEMLKRRIIVPEEIELVESFIMQFRRLSKGKKEMLDLAQVLNCLPIEITPLSVNQVLTFDFLLAQDALITFTFEKTSDLFEHYDQRVSKRHEKLKVKLKHMAADILAIKNHLVPVNSDVKADYGEDRQEESPSLPPVPKRRKSSGIFGFKFKL